MNEDSLPAVYDFVERAYLRLQAGEVLNHCLDKGDYMPMQTLVEELVLVGPQSLAVMREIIAEVASRKAQLQDDRSQIFHKLVKNLRHYGIRLTRYYTPHSIGQANPIIFLAFLNQQGVTEDAAQLHCIRLFQDTQELMDSLGEHFKLLDEIEVYIEDWLWGLIHQFTRQERSDLPKITGNFDTRWKL